MTATDRATIHAVGDVSYDEIEEEPEERQEEGPEEHHSPIDVLSDNDRARIRPEMADDDDDDQETDGYGEDHKRMRTKMKKRSIIIPWRIPFPWTMSTTTSHLRGRERRR